MDERVKFIARYLQKQEPFSALCDQFGISRKTGYKWVDRYDAGGPIALRDRSRAPISRPHAVPALVTQEILRLRELHPLWGSRKLLVLLERTHPHLLLPAASTVTQILGKHGLIKKRKRVRRSDPYIDPLTHFTRPNSVWCADFKGHFPVNGDRCHPLTITDGYSRYLLRCKALPRPLTEPSMKVFESAFREFGLPDVIRTDNGPPFSSLAMGGLSRLSVWWIRLGIRPERIEPGHPEQNGRHERMHLTLKDATATPPKNNFRAQQKLFDEFQTEFNQVRPHEALGQEVPAHYYRPSSRAFPKSLPQPIYPDHFETVRAYQNGVIPFEGRQWHLTSCLDQELVGLEQMNEDCWKVYFGPVALGVLDRRGQGKHRKRYRDFLLPLDGRILTGRGRPKKVLPMSPV